MAEDKVKETQVEEVKSTEETQVEEVKKTTEEVVEQPKEKTFTQEEVDAIIQKRIAKLNEKQKTEKERLAELEEWKKEQELKAKVEKEQRVESNKETFENILNDLVKENHIEDVRHMLINKIDFENFNQAEAKALVKEKVNTIPGLGKVEVNVTTAKIEEAEVNNDPKEQPKNDEPKYFLNGVEISEETFKGLSPIMKARVHIK